jgi:hypothetical protein
MVRDSLGRGPSTHLRRRPVPNPPAARRSVATIAMPAAASTSVSGPSPPPSVSNLKSARTPLRTGTPRAAAATAAGNHGHRLPRARYARRRHPFSPPPYPRLHWELTNAVRAGAGAGQEVGKSCVVVTI